MSLLGGGCATEPLNFAGGGLGQQGTSSGEADEDLVTATEGQVSAADPSATSSTTTGSTTSPADPPGEDATGSTGEPAVPPTPAYCSELPSVAGLALALACVPEGMEGKTGQPAALVVALHASAQTAQQYQQTTQWDVLAGQHGFYVVFPQTPADPLGVADRPAAWKWWRDFLDWTRDSANPHFEPLLEVVGMMQERHDIDPQRVFITGLSAGGYMSTLMLATHPDVFSAGAVFGGGPHNCDLQCTDSDWLQDWTRPPGYVVPGAADVLGAFTTWWDDPAQRKPRLLLVHGQLDETVSPINLSDAVNQWTGAWGIDAQPDNAALGEPSTLGDGMEYRAYAHDGEIAVATISVPGLGHGTPVRPGSQVDEGGYDPTPSTVANPCSPSLDPSCEQDWTHSGPLYGPYEAARFFGLLDSDI